MRQTPRNHEDSHLSGSSTGTPLCFVGCIGGAGIAAAVLSAKMNYLEVLPAHNHDGDNCERYGNHDEDKKRSLGVVTAYHRAVSAHRPTTPRRPPSGSRTSGGWRVLTIDHRNLSTVSFINATLCSPGRARGSRRPRPGRENHRHAHPGPGLERQRRPGSRAGPVPVERATCRGCPIIPDSGGLPGISADSCGIPAESGLDRASPETRNPRIHA